MLGTPREIISRSTVVNKKSLLHYNNTIVELQHIARQVLRIGDGFRSDPESILIAKEGISVRLMALARRTDGEGRVAA